MLAAVKLTLGMIQRRDDIRQLLGDGYQEQASVARAILRGISAERGVTLTDAALDLCIEMGDAGEPSHIVIAALVDELEGAK